MFHFLVPYLNTYIICSIFIRMILSLEKLSCRSVTYLVRYLYLIKYLLCTKCVCKYDEWKVFKVDHNILVIR